MSKKKKIKELEVFLVGIKVLLNNRIEGIAYKVFVMNLFEYFDNENKHKGFKNV